MNELDDYVEKANKREELGLLRQKREALAECRRVHKMLKKKRVFKKEIEYIEKRMIPFITRQKWMPWSFRNFLEMWEDKYYKLGGKYSAKI